MTIKYILKVTGIFFTAIFLTYSHAVDHPSGFLLQLNLQSSKKIKNKATTQASCYWMENYTGEYHWIPSHGTKKAQCYQLDSCDGGQGYSGGGCYKWAISPDAQRLPW